MTNFEIARRYTGLSGVELAKLLGVSPQQLNGWIQGARVPSRTNVEEIAYKMGVDAAWLLGLPQKLAVWSPLDRTTYSCPIIRTEDIDGYGTLYIVWIDDLGDWLPVIVSNGVQFTPYDWQACDNARNASGIAGQRWIDNHGQNAVMLDGLPRATL